MAVGHLLAEVMYQLSMPWVTSGDPAQAAIEKNPMLAALLPQLQKAHAAIEAVLGQEDANQQALSQQEAEIDNKHDTMVRGIYGSLTMLAVLSPQKDELLSLRNWLFPEGLLHTQKSYRGEAGHAALVASHLDAIMEARLRAVSLHDQNLFDLVQQWFAAAKQLGDLEDERARLAAASSTASEVRAARAGWARTVNLFVANAAAADLDAETDTLLFSALRAAERAAATRARPHPAPAPAPQPQA